MRYVYNYRERKRDTQNKLEPGITGLPFVVGIFQAKRSIRIT